MSFAHVPPIWVSVTIIGDELHLLIRLSTVDQK